MADNNRNQSRDYRSYNQDWNDNERNQRNWDDRNSNYGSQENRDFGYSGSNARFDEGNENRWSRGSDQNRERGSGRYNRDYDSGNSNYGNQEYGNQGQNYGYGGREYGSNYGGGGYQGNSSYYGSGSSGSGYGGSRPSYGSSRNLYDRDYEGYNRDSNRDYSGHRSYSGLGGANYGGANEDRGRRNYEEGRNWGTGSGYYSGRYGSSEGGRYGRGDSNERSWWDRTRDEVSSWFGDDDAERRREHDRQLNYRGKGPRSYNRSDDRIKEDINDRLSDDPWLDATDIDVTVSNGEVTLTGTVTERSAKRRAEDIADAVSGVKNVENRIRVGQTAGTGAGSSTMASQTGVTGTGGTASSKEVEKNKAKSGYVTG